MKGGIFIICLIISFLLSDLSFAQNSKSYRVVYKPKVRISVDTLTGPSDFVSILKSSIKKTEQTQFILTISNEVSNFKQSGELRLEVSVIDKVSIPQLAGVKGEYINDGKSIFHSCEIANTPITVNLKSKIDWLLTQERKSIQGYVCYKASGIRLYGRNKGQSVVVWYTPEVPVSFGPKEYYGLPGLILEVDEKDVSLTAVKIEPTKPITIEIPNKRILSEKEAEKLRESENRKAEDFMNIKNK
ncbi:MAG: GLPGLI family protein [Leeuwenhoekiella sp.]